MAGYQADTFQCAPLILIKQIACRCEVTKKLGATSFCISCAKCLWDAVGHFLGCRIRPQDTGPSGLRCSLPLARAQVISNHFK